MIVNEQRILHNLLGLKVTKIDHRHARIGFIIDKEPIPVVVTFGFGECRVMGIPPAVLFAEDISFIEDIVSYAVTIPLPWLGGEYRDGLEQSH